MDTTTLAAASTSGKLSADAVVKSTFSSWALLAFAARQWWAGGAALGLRLAAGYLVGAVLLRDRLVARWFWLMPLRDLFGLAVWVAGCFGSTVYWRGRKLRLAADGRIAPIDAPRASR